MHSRNNCNVSKIQLKHVEICVRFTKMFEVMSLCVDAGLKWLPALTDCVINDALPEA